MKTRQKSKEDESESGSDSEPFEMPETVICIDTICNICYAEFIDEEDLKLHISQMHLTEQSRSRYCQFCSTIFASIEEYASHICDVHILNLKCCRYCMRAFSHTPEVAKHEKKHFNPRIKSSFCCSNCNLTFRSVSELEDHEYAEHKDAKDGVMLHDCYSMLSSFLNMNAPKFLQSLGKDNVFTCASCKINTTEIDYYMQHLQQKNCRSLVCDKCCNVYKNTKSIIKHFFSHPECRNGHNGLKKSCPKCNKTFNLQLLRQHTKECNAIRCNSCDLIFETVSARTEHQVKYHKMTFSIKNCKYCHREFVGQVALDKHIDRLHKKDLHLYKYFCVYCDDIFNHPKKLFSHFYGKHKELKPFTCQICDKTFRLRKQFTLHIKVDHLSVGTVKFDENFHVFFTDEVSSSAAFQPETNSTIDESQPADSLLEPLKIGRKEKTTDYNSESLLIPRKEKVVKMINNDVDFVMCATETEADQTDIDTTKTAMITRKRKYKTRTKEASTHVDLTKGDYSDNTSADEPLMEFKRRVKTKEVQRLGFTASNKKSKEMEKNRLKFTCKICKKYCYTFQNFNHHMSLHQTNGNKKCIKCPKVFKSKDKLIRHIQQDHSSSKLTDTLKTVLERRKNSQNIPIENQIQNEVSRTTMTKKFLRTIKKVKLDGNSAQATVTPVINKLSVKKFIENFTPETNEMSKNDKNIKINNSVTIKSVMAPINKTPVIKLNKFKPEVQPKFLKLKLPERFKDSITEPYNVSIKLVQQPNAKPKMHFDLQEEDLKPHVNTSSRDEHQYEEMLMEDTPDDADEGETDIPEVAEEIMLEETVDIPKPKTFMHKIVIPNLPKQYKNVHIAHLLPEAPFYKIVKIDEVLKENKKDLEKQSEKQKIKLPDGTKLVNVNPLAHLLGDKQLELPRNKYYKPKVVDFEKAVAKALSNSKIASGVKKNCKIKIEQ